VKWLSIIAVAVISVSAAACGDPKPVEGSTWSRVDPSHDARWRAYLKAFPVRDSWLTGPDQLIPTGDGCFMGVGADSAPRGMLPAIWIATGDCSTSKLDRPDGTDALLRGNISSLDSAVVADDGTFLALGQTAVGDPAAYGSFAVRGRPGAWWPPVARFQVISNVRPFSPDVVGPDVLIARPGGGFVAVGESGPDLFAWSSGDGISWTRSPIPIPDGMKRVEIVSAATGSDGTIAVVGLKTIDPTVYQSQALAWYSTDRGSTWHVATVPADPGAWPMALVHDGKRFVAMGMVLHDGKPSDPWALTSVDGATWQREPGLEPAGTRGFYAATVLSDGRIAAISAGSASSSPPPEQVCGPTVLFLGGPSIIEERLGCNPVPSTIIQLKDGRLAASMGEHLWLREPVGRE